MAQKISVILTDDVDGSEATQTRTFALDGVNYEIDLSDKNSEKLSKAFAVYAEKARRVGRASTAKPARSKPARSTEETQAIREWAKANGLDVSERGRISKDIEELYAAR